MPKEIKKTNDLPAGVDIEIIAGEGDQPPRVAIVFGEFNTVEEIRSAIPKAFDVRDQALRQSEHSVIGLRELLSQAQKKDQWDISYSYGELARLISRAAAYELVQHVKCERVVNRVVKDHPEIKDLPVDQWDDIDPWFGYCYFAVENGRFINGAIQTIMGAIGHTKSSLEKACEYVEDGLRTTRKASDDVLSTAYPWDMFPVEDPDFLDSVWPEDSHYFISTEQVKDAISNYRRKNNK